LKAIEWVFRKQLPQSTLDLGTGTGLLALAAARLGCKKILAVDINYLATTTAYHNIRLNHMQDRIAVVQGKAEDMIALRADMVIANIHYDVLQRLISSEGFRGKKWFVLSGLMRDQARAVASQLMQRSSTIRNQWVQDDIWHTLCGSTG
jgi:ribosomal protein L11 methyltransferase